MATQKALVKGIDTTKLEAFNQQYKAAPQTFTLGLEAKTIWKGKVWAIWGRSGAGHLEDRQSKSRRAISLSNSVPKKRWVMQLA